MSAPWITYRPEIQVLDCTIRDGGLVNGHHFDDSFVRTVYQTCIEAGVDYMEIGYKNSDKIFSRDKFGNWKFCREEDVCRALGDIVDGVKLTAMIDAGRVDWKNDVLPRDRSIFTTMRVAFYVHQLSEAVDMIRDAHEKGYEVWANLMAASTAKEIEIDQSLEILSRTPASVLVVVDSYGSMYAETIEHLVKKYLRFGKETNKEEGFTPIITNNLRLPILLRRLFTVPIGLMRLLADLVAVRVIARWNFCLVSYEIRNSKFVLFLRHWIGLSLRFADKLIGVRRRNILSPDK
jgi:4-hydroxy 2-oxovalerate aldolase